VQAVTNKADTDAIQIGEDIEKQSMITCK